MTGSLPPSLRLFALQDIECSLDTLHPSCSPFRSRSKPSSCGRSALYWEVWTKNQTWLAGKLCTRTCRRCSPVSISGCGRWEGIIPEVAMRFHDALLQLLGLHPSAPTDPARSRPPRTCQLPDPIHPFGETW